MNFRKNERIFVLKLDPKKGTAKGEWMTFEKSRIEYLEDVINALQLQIRILRKEKEKLEDQLLMKDLLYSRMAIAIEIKPVLDKIKEVKD